ncbi:hypothetical protein SMGES_44350 [Serratia marcescens]|nr:hypothetical protein SMGES_44350 [Serratia marcescens]
MRLGCQSARACIRNWAKPPRYLAPEPARGAGSLPPDPRKKIDLPHPLNAPAHYFIALLNRFFYFSTPSDKDKNRD